MLFPKVLPFVLAILRETVKSYFFLEALRLCGNI